MADSKITAYTALTGANVDTAADVLEIVDVSVTTNKKILVDELRIALLSNTALTNSISGDVSLNNTSNYFDGPVVTQGTTGVWWVSGTITLTDSSGGTAQFHVKLWDGTSVFASLRQDMVAANSIISCSLSGRISAPAGNIRISVRDLSSTSGLIKANTSGLGFDSTITAIRIG